MNSNISKLAEKMRANALPSIAVETFVKAADFVASGGETMIPESEIEPAGPVRQYADLEGFERRGYEALGQTVIVKLNGGLGTSMGLSKAKALLPVRPGISFLDLIARQVLHQREAHSVQMPLVLMNSYRTQHDSLEVLGGYPDLHMSFPLDFLQHKVPRVLVDSFAPVVWPEDPDLEWCPPGHGDLYIAMASSGMLGSLLERGYRYCFVSNADNLGAVLDPSILGWMAGERLPFAMEVAARTEADKKGGHLARTLDGRLILRETAQCPEEDKDSFQNIDRHRYFNTNNLWLDLRALAAALESGDGFDLPVMCNQKQVSAKHPESPQCYQLETAMGSAISRFAGAQAVEVPRTRFAPVKTTNDLLVLWSDAYEVTSDHRVVPIDAAAQTRRVIDLDPDYFGKIDDMMARFPHGAPSLAGCERWIVSGDHRFAEGVIVEGNVELTNTTDEVVEVPAGTVLR